MTVTTLARESARSARGGFRVPRYEIAIDGTSLSHAVLRDVMRVTYHDSVQELDGFELVLGNWDTASRTFKYVGAETAEDIDGSGPRAQLVRLFEPCGQRVELRLGYLDSLQLMLTGSVTTLEPRFTGAAAALTVRGLNVMHELRRKQYTWAWERQRDSEIALDLGGKRDPDSGNKRFPLPIVVDSDARQREPVLPYVAQQNQYDIDFLATRALERGYVVFVQEADPARNLPRRLWFGPSSGGGPEALSPVTYELVWGKGLMEFHPTLTTANQVRSVTVHGWNRRTRKEVQAKVDLDDPELNRNKDLHHLLQRCDPREDVVVARPAQTEEDARRHAVAELIKRQRTMVRARASCVGLPDLRAGRLVRILGLGARFSGTYFITETTHVLDENGYLTQFSCYREDVAT
jgi:phage protein D